MRRKKNNDKNFADRIRRKKVNLIDSTKILILRKRVLKIAIAVSTLVLFVTIGGIWGVSKTTSRERMETENTPGIGSALSNLTVAVDAGHGGVDPGAVGAGKSLEKDVTLAISQKLQVLLIQAGCNVVMIRDTDCDFGTGSNLLQRKREDLAYRTQKAFDADIYLSIHANSFPDRSQHGAQVFYHSESPEGKTVAELVQESLNQVAARKRIAKSQSKLFYFKKDQPNCVDD